MLGATRKGIIQSFGTEPGTIVEHCLASIRIRKERDMRLTLVMVVFGLLFLPGMLIWLAVFQLRRTLAGAKDRRVGALGTILLVAVTVLPFAGRLFDGLYLAAALGLGAVFIAFALTLQRRADRRWALRTYLFSLAYLALLFGAMVADARL